MLQLGAIGFLQPWILAALAGLPLLWWLLRVTPPAPRRQSFPALRLLLGLAPPEETPARTPWWLLLLRLLAASLIIVGLAQPLLNPSAQLGGSGPLVLVIDDSWGAARNWGQRQTAAQELLDQADRAKRPVILLTTAPSELDEPMAPSGHLTASEARRRIQGLSPKPWPTDRNAARQALEGLDVPPTSEVVWLSDGLRDAPGEALAEALADIGRLTVLRDPTEALPHLVLPPENQATGMTVRVKRASPRAEGLATVSALGEDGSLIGRGLATFADGERVAEITIELPVELRNRIARLVIEGESQAGAVLLLDERWRRRPVGIITSAAQEQRQPLLSEVHYLDRALEPFTELRRGDVDELLKRDLAVMIQPDSSQISDQDMAAITDWIERGGLLLRFAGPQLAEVGGDDLLPVTLRGGGRVLGGVMTWDSPAQLAPFERDSPFEDLVVPTDVWISSQVLAEPTLDLADKTWARLSDGTPLVTADARGDGWVVLVHTTANTLWSDLALSGLYVDLLRRIVAVSQGIQSESEGELALPPLQTLDGFGRLEAPPPTVLAAEPAVFEDALIGPRNPPGYYGGVGQQRALNLIDANPALEPIERVPAGASLTSYAKSVEADLKPWLLLAALVLILLDLMIALGYRGLIRRGLRHGTAALLVLALVPVTETWAQTDDSFAMDATLQTRLAFVITGDPAVDQASEAGLTGLSRMLQRRTSVEAGPPMAVDLERDELAFFPLLYWPVTTTQPTLSQAARDRVNHYLRHGGTILFDQRQAGRRHPVPRPGERPDPGPAAPGRGTRHPAPDSGAARPRDHQVVLFDAGLPGPLRRRHPVDRRHRGPGQRRRHLGA